MYRHYLKRVKWTAVLVILINFSCLANSRVINATVLNSGENSAIKILDYSIVQKTIAISPIKSNSAIVNIQNDINDGVYRVEIKLSNNKVFNFDIIIYNEEKNISFEYDCNQEFNMPVFKNSLSNSNWYLFLQKQNFKISTINFLNENTSESSLGQNIDRKSIINIETEELLKMQLNFIKESNNFWSTNMVMLDYAKIISKNKDDFYNYIELSNPKLINSPIFNNAIQYYIIKYYNPKEFCKVDKEKIIQEAFENTIKAFSKNNEVKNWAFKFIKYGLKEMNLVDLEEYFQKKYQF